jgi:hypothetical protein
MSYIKVPVTKKLQDFLVNDILKHVQNTHLHNVHISTEKVTLDNVDDVLNDIKGQIQILEGTAEDIRGLIFACEQYKDEECTFFEFLHFLFDNFPNARISEDIIDLFFQHEIPHSMQEDLRTRS